MTTQTQTVNQCSSSRRCVSSSADEFGLVEIEVNTVGRDYGRYEDINLNHLTQLNWVSFKKQSYDDPTRPFTKTRCLVEILGLVERVVGSDYRSSRTDFNGGVEW